ncbi:hypothetical protein D3C87_05210 [compost metagenome]
MINGWLFCFQEKMINWSFNHYLFFMKTPIRLTGTVAAAILLIVLGCNKEQVRPNPAKIKKDKHSEVTTKTLHCSPWRDVYGCTEAAADLNEVGLCNTSSCTGTQVVTHINNIVVHETGNSNPMYLSDWDPILIADQNVIWNQAVSEAVFMTPSGYTLASIHNFRIQVVSVGMLLTNIMRYDITYRKCTGGGPGGGS